MIQCMFVDVQFVFVDASVVVFVDASVVVFADDSVHR